MREESLQGMRERVCRHYKALRRRLNLAPRLQSLIICKFYIETNYIFSIYYFCLLPCLTFAETGHWTWLSEGWKCDSLRFKVWAAVCLKGLNLSYIYCFNLSRSEIFWIFVLTNFIDVNKLIFFNLLCGPWIILLLNFRFCEAVLQFYCHQVSICKMHLRPSRQSGTTLVSFFPLN